MRPFRTDEICLSRLRQAGYELWVTACGEICSLIHIEQQREVLIANAEAQDVLAEVRSATLRDRAADLIGITLVLATFVVAVPLFTGWAAI